MMMMMISAWLILCLLAGFHSHERVKDLSKRHEAEYVLQEGAWNRALDPNASIGERAMGYLVTNAMKGKRKLGGRISKKKSVTPSYSKYPALLNKEEQQINDFPF